MDERDYEFLERTNAESEKTLRVVAICSAVIFIVLALTATLRAEPRRLPIAASATLPAKVLPMAKPLSVDDLPPLKFTLPKPEPKAPLTVPADHHYHYAGCCGVYFAHDGKAGSRHSCPLCGRGNWTTIVRAPAKGTTVYLNPAREVKSQRSDCPQ